MAKNPKHIKVDLRSKQSVIPVTPSLPKPPIPDLIITFASDDQIFNIRVAASQMGKAVKMLKTFMDSFGIIYSIEEKPR